MGGGQELVGLEVKIWSWRSRGGGFEPDGRGLKAWR